MSAFGGRADIRSAIEAQKFNITGAVNGRQRPHPVIARTVTVEAQRHSPKEASAAKAVTPVVVSEKADAKKSKHYKPKMFARQRDNYGYWNARGYAQRGSLFPLIRRTGDQPLPAALDCRGNRRSFRSRQASSRSALHQGSRGSN